METSLYIEGVYFPEGSARGCTQELFPLPHAQSMFQRTTNGDLVFLGAPDSLKYRTVIRCNDQKTPVFAHKNLGDLLTVHCIQYLAQPLDQVMERNGRNVFGAKLSRSFITDSLNGYVAHEKLSDPIFSDDTWVWTNAAHEKMYVLYRPILSMRLRDFHILHNEWGMDAGWKMILDEV